jgi:hypothetical protein
LYTVLLIHIGLLRAPHLAIPVCISAFKKASKKLSVEKNGVTIGRVRALSEPVGARKSEKIKILKQAIFRSKILGNFCQTTS